MFDRLIASGQPMTLANRASIRAPGTRKKNKCRGQSATRPKRPSRAKHQPQPPHHPPTRDPDTPGCPPGLRDESFNDQLVGAVVYPVPFLVKSVFRFLIHWLRKRIIHFCARMIVVQCAEQLLLSCQRQQGQCRVFLGISGKIGR